MPSFKQVLYDIIMTNVKTCLGFPGFVGIVASNLWFLFLMNVENKETGIQCSFLAQAMSKEICQLSVEVCLETEKTIQTM